MFITTLNSLPLSFLRAELKDVGCNNLFELRDANTKLAS